MPLDTPAHRTVQRLLVLTLSLGPAIDQLDQEEIDAILRSRHNALKTLSTQELDSAALAVLQQVQSAEREMGERMRASRQKTIRAVAEGFQARKSLGGYFGKSAAYGVDRVG